MNADDEPTVIVSQPIATAENVIPGSITTACQDCYEIVWVSPSSLPIMLEDGTEVICTSCLKKRLDKAPNEPVRIRRIRREQLDEIETWRKERKRRGPRLQDW